MKLTHPSALDSRKVSRQEMSTGLINLVPSTADAQYHFESQGSVLKTHENSQMFQTVGTVDTTLEPYNNTAAAHTLNRPAT